MAKKLEEGVWRTIGGRRVFIKTGQSLKDAMRDSGKFKIKDEYKKVDKEWHELSNKMEKDFDEFGTTNWQDEKRLNELSNKRDSMQYKLSPEDVKNYSWSRDEKGTTYGYKNQYGYTINQLQIDDEAKEYRVGSFTMRNDKTTTRKDFNSKLEELEGAGYKKVDEWSGRKGAGSNTSNIKPSLEDKFYTRKDGTKEYDPYKGTPYEKKYDSVDEAIKDPNSALNKYIKEKESKEHHFAGEELYSDDPNRFGDLRAYNEKMNPTNYYETGNTYWNGKGKYRDYVDSIENLSDEELMQRGLSKGLIKEYRDEAHRYYRWFNDGDKPHLKTLNGEKSYPSSGDYLHRIASKGERQYWSEVYGNDMETRINNILDKMQQAESKKSLTSRYSGTIDYLKQTTNMSPAQILELLKKIDSNKK